MSPQLLPVLIMKKEHGLQTSKHYLRFTAKLKENIHINSFLV